MCIRVSDYVSTYVEKKAPLPHTHTTYREFIKHGRIHAHRIKKRRKSLQRKDIRCAIGVSVYPTMHPRIRVYATCFSI